MSQVTIYSTVLRIEDISYPFADLMDGGLSFIVKKTSRDIIIYLDPTHTRDDIVKTPFGSTVKEAIIELDRKKNVVIYPIGMDSKKPDGYYLTETCIYGVCTTMIKRDKHMFFLGYLGFRWKNNDNKRIDEHIDMFERTLNFDTLSLLKSNCMGTILVRKVTLENNIMSKMGTSRGRHRKTGSTVSLFSYGDAGTEEKKELTNEDLFHERTGSNPNIDFSRKFGMGSIHKSWKNAIKSPPSRQRGISVTGPHIPKGCVMLPTPKDDYPELLHSPEQDHKKISIIKTKSIRRFTLKGIGKKVVSKSIPVPITSINSSANIASPISEGTIICEDLETQTVTVINGDVVPDTMTMSKITDSPIKGQVQSEFDVLQLATTGEASSEVNSEVRHSQIIPPIPPTPSKKGSWWCCSSTV